MRRSAVVALALCLVAPRAWSDPPRATSVTVGDVRVEGEGRSSSTDVPRAPRYDLHNRGATARTVTLVSLTSLGTGRERLRLRITSPRVVVLPPHARRTVDVTFDGRALSAGGGLTYHRFVLRVSVGGAEAEAVASNAYVCRIPVRRLP